MKALTERQTGWLAGVIDSEGSITIRPTRSPQFRVQFGTTDFDVARRAHRLTGIGHLNGPYPGSGNKPKLDWRVHRRADVAALLTAIYPDLSARRKRRARKVLRLIAAAGPVQRGRWSS
jgi:hypothetical protein